MATVAHKDLTGADLHEPKGVASAASGTVYVANGAGSGSWTTLAALSGSPGKVEWFATPVVPSGWLECDGTAVSRSTYVDLFNALTIQQTGSRTNGSPTITGLTTTDMKVGYYVGGTGITNGTTISAVAVGQITMSANAGSTGSATVIVSPWPLGNGTTTFTLPDISTAGRYVRARNATGRIGLYHADTIKAHSHDIPEQLTSVTPNHTHAITDTGHVHGPSSSALRTNNGVNNDLGIDAANVTYSMSFAGNTASATTGISVNAGGSHAHFYGGSGHATSNQASGAAETAPITVLLMACIKT